VPLDHRGQDFPVAKAGKDFVPVAALLALKQEVVLGDFVGEVGQAARAGDVADGSQK
jgi:hypothetical protein